MQCAKCENEATVHFVKITDGEPVDVHFCHEHAEAELYEDVAPLPLPLGLEGDVHVTVEVTQSQLDNGETVPVQLPSGQQVDVELHPQYATGDEIIRGRYSVGGLRLVSKQGCAHIVIKVVPE